MRGERELISDFLGLRSQSEQLHEQILHSSLFTHESVCMQGVMCLKESVFSNCQ